MNRENRAALRRELSPAALSQPAERSLRYDNIRSAMAEEGVLRLLLRDDSLFPPQPPLKEEQFSSPLLGRVFSLLWQAREEGRALTLPALAGALTQEEMSHITSLCQRPESLKNGKQALADYIAVISEEWERRTASGEDPLAAAMRKNKYKNKSGTGGKRNV